MDFRFINFENWIARIVSFVLRFTYLFSLSIFYRFCIRITISVLCRIGKDCTIEEEFYLKNSKHDMNSIYWIVGL